MRRTLPLAHWGIRFLWRHGHNTDQRSKDQHHATGASHRPPLRSVVIGIAFSPSCSWNKLSGNSLTPAMAWSQRQQVVLAIVPKVSSTFSLFGSGWILIEVLTDRSSVPKRKHPYHRLLLGMSVYDILESIWNFVSTWAIPQGTEGVWDASGTTATCTAQGFFLTLSVAVPIYNAFLSLYYVLVRDIEINRSDFLDRDCCRRLSPLRFLLVLRRLTTTYLLGDQLWYPRCQNRRAGRTSNALGCIRMGFLYGILFCHYRFIEQRQSVVRTLVFVLYPSRRNTHSYVVNVGVGLPPYRLDAWTPDTMETREIVQGGKMHGYIDGYSISCLCGFASFLRVRDWGALRLSWSALAKLIHRQFCFSFSLASSSIAVCTISVYRKVQTYDRITAKYRHPPDRPLHRFNGGISSVASEGSLSQPPSSSADWRSSFSGHTVRKTARSIHDNDCPGDVDSHIDDPIQGLGQVDEREVEAYGDERETAWWDLRSDWRRWQLKRQIFREDHPRTAEVFQQALWYLGVFYLTHVWSTTNRTIQLIKNGRTYFPIIAVHSFFDPLQGFLNWLVYQRPRYVRIRKACPDVGRWGALKMTLTFTSFGGEEPLRRGLPAASALSVSNPRWWPFSPVSRNPGLSSQEGLAGEFYVPQQRAHISSVSGISDVMDVRRHENLCVVPEKSGELSESELQSEDEHRTKTPSTLNSTNGSESEIDAIQVNVLKRTVTGAGEKTKGDTLSDGSNRKDGQ